MEERNVDKLSGWIMKLAVVAVICAACWYFRSVLVYVLAAFVVSLLGQPIMQLFRKIKIKGKALPDAFLAVVTILVILLAVSLLVTQLIPVVVHIVRDASAMNAQDVPYNSLLDQVDEWLVSVFPALGKNFNLVSFILEQIRSVMSVSSVTSLIGSVASVAADVAIGLFSVVFISFFFIKDEKLFGKIISAAGVLNIIPYVGPLIGEVIGVLLCVVLKYGAGVGLAVPIWIFALIVLAVMLTAQLIDNFVYQPIIYSTSIKSTPLEIFIVLLVAGQIGGTAGLLVGIPVYTVVRVIAARFFYQHKAVRRLMPDIDEEKTDWLL